MKGPTIIRSVLVALSGMGAVWFQGLTVYGADGPSPEFVRDAMRQARALIRTIHVKMEFTKPPPPPDQPPAELMGPPPWVEWWQDGDSVFYREPDPLNQIHEYLYKDHIQKALRHEIRVAPPVRPALPGMPKFRRRGGTKPASSRRDTRVPSARAKAR